MSESQKFELARMTFKEAEMAYAKNPVILIPLGSTEQHGPQTPTGDFRLANALSLDIAKRTGSISAPVIPYSEGAAARDFPGNVSLRRETLYELTWDVCRSFTRFGLDHIMLVCGDHGNVPVLENMIRDFKDSEGVRIGMVEQYRWFTPEWLAEIYDRPSPPIGHGGDPIMSLNMHLFPEDVRPDLCETLVKKDFQGLTPLSFNQMKFDNHMFYLPVDYSELSPNGVRGDSTIASSEVGSRIWDGFVERGVAIVERFKDVDTRCEPKPW